MMGNTFILLGIGMAMVCNVFVLGESNTDQQPTSFIEMNCTNIDNCSSIENAICSNDTFQCTCAENYEEANDKCLLVNDQDCIEDSKCSSGNCESKKCKDSETDEEPEETEGNYAQSVAVSLGMMVMCLLVDFF